MVINKIAFYKRGCTYIYIFLISLIHSCHLLLVVYYLCTLYPISDYTTLYIQPPYRHTYTCHCHMAIRFSYAYAVDHIQQLLRSRTHVQHVVGFSWLPTVFQPHSSGSSALVLIVVHCNCTVRR